MHDLINDALSGSRGEDQKLIAETGEKFLETLLRKNRDYGSSAFKVPVLKPDLDAGDAILVRMSDKIERISSLSSKNAEVKESLEDTISDLGAYCILWLICKEKQRAQEERKQWIASPIGGPTSTP